MATWKEIAYVDNVATLSDLTPQSVGTSAAAGTGTDASRDDHVHDLGTGCIDASALFAAGVVDTTALGADAVDGTKIADDAIDSEHYTDGSIDTTHLAADVVDATKIADDAVGSEHIEALSAALDFAGQQATDMVVMQSSAAPGTPVVGKLWHDSDDQKLYICTSVA